MHRQSQLRTHKIQEGFGLPDQIICLTGGDLDTSLDGLTPTA